MRVSGCRKREVSHIFLGIACLLERAEHQVREDTLLGLACKALSKPLVMPGSDLQIGGLDLLLESRIALALIAPAHPHATCRGQFRAQRIPESRGDLLEFEDSLGVRL